MLILLKQMKNVSSLLFIFVLFIFSVHNYPTCDQKQINGYLYQLSNLPTNANNLFMVKQGVSTAYFSFCQPKQSCPDNKTSFLTYSTATTCVPFTSIFLYYKPKFIDPTKPMKQNYTLIDLNNPEKGIIINFLPYYDEVNNIRRYATLNIYCPSVNTIDQQCNYTKVSGTKQTMVCNLNNHAGCAKLKLNYFWQFLSDNRIVFAILLWVMALFELFFGYLAIRMTIFIYGILTGAIFGIIYVAQNYVDFIYQSQGYGIAIFVVCLSFLMGILFGVSLLTMPRLGYVNIGLWVAMIFALLLQNSVLYLTGSLLAFYITFGVVGLIMSIIALLKLRNYIILSTSFVSAFWLVRPLGFFLTSYPNQFLSGQKYLINESTDWRFYLYLVSIIILTILGAVFQFCCFKSKATGNQAYYLEEEGSFKQKLKKLLEFQQVKNLIQSGADELRFFKNLIVEDTEDQKDYKKGKQPKVLSNRKRSQDINSQDMDQFSDDQQSTGRKKTKLQKQLDDYNSKRKQTQQTKKVRAIYMPQKSQQDQKPQPTSTSKSKNNKKVQQVEQIQFSQQQEQQEKYNKKKDQKQVKKKSSDQQSEDIKPNKLFINKRNNAKK